MTPTTDTTTGTTTGTLDLGPQALVVARLVAGVPDERLGGRTPCPGYPVRHLLGHLAGLAVAFRDAGRKKLGATTDTSPEAALPDIGPGRREDLLRVLDELAAAWRDPAAWTGKTRAGGIDLPGAVAGAVVADELVIHGWDRLTSRAVAHDTEAYGLRAECQGSVLAYSGDSGPCEALTELTSGADLFLCEADIDRHRESEGSPQVHLTPEDAGDAARKAGVREPYITHVGPTLTRQTATVRAAAAFGGPTRTAREGETIPF
ncbi:MBL fold metallo-hydrolase [Streptomyces antibioticus]|uniref:MBL fold metallo-hydrolase n=1 Tax=Streptomyces antibioticus TaxID=1890 RepID=UPI0036CADDC6